MKIQLTLIATLLAAVQSALAVSDGPDAQLRRMCAAKAAGTPVVRGGEGWFFLPAELRHVSAGKFWGEDAAKVSKAARREAADPLPAILDFKNQLDHMGIDLILVPVPAKVFVYPEAILGGSTTGPALGRMDAFHQQFYDELRKNGITLIDLLPDFLEKRNSPEGAMYCHQDTHWSGIATILTAQKIAILLKDKPWLKDAPKARTKAGLREVEIEGDLRGMLTGDKPAPEKLKLRFVGTQESNGGTPVAPDKSSPVVLLGDSHNLVFSAGEDMLATGAGLPDQLALELGIAVDLVAVRGSGATPARINLMRRAKADPAYLAGKKVVIWCFTVRELTESTGWLNVPIISMH